MTTSKPKLRTGTRMSLDEYPGSAVKPTNTVAWSSFDGELSFT